MKFLCFDSKTSQYIPLVAVKMHHLEDGVPQTVVVKIDGKDEEWVIGARFRLEVEE